jgi:hypothetical protein
LQTLSSTADSRNQAVGGSLFELSALLLDAVILRFLVSCGGPRTAGRYFRTAHDRGTDLLDPGTIARRRSSRAVPTAAAGIYKDLHAMRFNLACAPVGKVVVAQQIGLQVLG